MTINASKEQMETEIDESIANSTSDSDTEPDNFENDNSAWADSIAKILKSNKPKGKKVLVLSKGKKLSSVVEKSSKLDFEIQSANGEIKSEHDAKARNDKDIDKLQRKKKKKQLSNVHVKPGILNKGRERTLSKIATKGVVQLFNAIKSQQININNKLQEAGSLEIKKQKVLKNVDKRAFLDRLMGEESESLIEKEKIQNCGEEKSWNVLRDDFMMGAKLKDWDKELEKEIEFE